jgi:hypothetical protein
MKPIRRIGASIIIDADGHEHKNCVVELSSFHAVSIYPITHEQPGIEWFPGTVIIEDGRPYQLVSLADGTQRRRPL